MFAYCGNNPIIYQDVDGRRYSCYCENGGSSLPETQKPTFRDNLEKGTMHIRHLKENIWIAIDVEGAAVSSIFVNGYEITIYKNDGFRATWLDPVNELFFNFYAAGVAENDVWVW